MRPLAKRRIPHFNLSHLITEAGGAFLFLLPIGQAYPFTSNLDRATRWLAFQHENKLRVNLELTLCYGLIISLDIWRSLRIMNQLHIPPITHISVARDEECSNSNQKMLQVERRKFCQERFFWIKPDAGAASLLQRGRAQVLAGSPLY